MKRASVLLALTLAACGSDHDPAPTVATAEVIRGGFSLERDGDAERVIDTARVEEGATAVTAEDGRGGVRLDSGAWILFDHDTRGTVQLSTFRLEAGRVWVDASSANETTIETEHGSVRADDATFAVELTDAGAAIYCGSGELTYVSEGGSDRMSQGERVVLAGATVPEVEPADLWDDWTGGLADPGRSRHPRATHLGVLAGRRPDQNGEARTPLPIRAHEVGVSLSGDLATTEVTQTFFNARSDTLEGEWVIRLPRGAIVQSFAIDQGGAGFQEAVVNAMSVGSGYQLSWLNNQVQGAKLAYDGPDRLRARVHPIAPGATVRVRLRYTEWLDRRDGARTYVYPMEVEGEPPLLGEFILQVDTSGAPLSGMRAGMGATVEDGRVVLRQSDFRPRADFYLDLYDEEAPPEDQVRAYVVTAPAEQGGGPAAEGQESYVLFDVPTETLVESEEGETPPLELVMLLDVSGETDPEDLEIARAVIEAVLRQVTPSDRVAIRLADVTAHAPDGAPEGLVPATEENREALLESIARVHLGGATDLGRSLRDAGQLVAGRPRAAVLYLGDGLPTTGDLDATALRATLATLDAPPRFFGLAIGDGANLELLRRLFDGHASRVEERTEAARTVMGVLAEAAAPTLRGVSIDLGENVERVYPRPPMLVQNGAHLRLVGRLVGPMPERVTVRGHFDGEPFEQRMSVRRDAVQDGGDIRKRWAQNRLGELVDEDAGREAMVDLGVRFSLVSPWTSLVVGGVYGGTVAPVQGFDHDPLAYAWGLGGGSPTVTAAELTSDAGGWRRRLGRAEVDVATAPESTWVSRVSDTDAPAPRESAGDGGLARAAVQRVLESRESGPRGCYERRSIVRPDLSGEMVVEVEVDGDGNARGVNIVRETVGDDDVRRCVETEIRGLPYPSTGAGGTVSVRHTLSFQMPEREFGARRQCSDASRQDLEVRRALWRERLAANSGVGGAISVWREAQRQCELSNWRARRTLLHMMIGQSGGVRGQVALYRAFRGNAAIADYLRRIILRNVRSPSDVEAVRAGLGLDVPVDWSLFSRLWKQNTDAAYRLRLVRRWLEVAPEEMDLRLRLLSLLEQTDELAEARRLARELRADPLADARVRTQVGEFWLRQDDEPEARRVFSELVERTPLDPWARRRLGDLYRAHGWADDAYREYRTLARLRPGDGAVLLLLARAAADAGRVDEALRLEQRLSESTDPSVHEGAAGMARLWTTVRLARLELDAETEEMRRAIRRRERESGALRDPPAIFAALTWRHPDDRPEMVVRYPSTDEDVGWEAVDLGGDDFGIYASRVREREDGEYLFEVRRADRDEIRDIEAELLVITGLGTDDERVARVPVTLARETEKRRFRLDGTEVTEVPARAMNR